MRTSLFFLVLIFLSVSMFLDVPDTVAEYAAHMRWNLPENAKARIGKGYLSGDIAYSPDGTLLAVASSIGVWLYDAETGEAHAVFIADESGVGNIAFSPDGTKLASIPFMHNFIQLWDVKTGVIETTFFGYGGSTTCVAFSPDGTKLVCGGLNRTVQLWDVGTREIIETLIIGDNGRNGVELSSIVPVSFSPDSTLLAAGNDDGTVQLWDVGTREPTTTLQHDSSIMSVVFSPDGSILAVGSEDGKVSLWDIRKSVLKFDFVAQQKVFSLAFSPDGKTLASAGSGFRKDKDRVRLWDVASGELKSNLIGHTDDVDSLVFSPDGTTLVSSSADNIVRFFDVASGELKFNLTGYLGSIHNIILSPNGQTLVSSSGFEERYATVRLWDVGTGTPKIQLPARKQIVYNASVSGGVPFVAYFNSETGLELYDVATGDLKTTFSESEWVLNVALSPDSKTLAATSGLGDSTARLWDVETGTLTTGLWHKDEAVNGVVFNPDNTKIAIKSWEGNVVYLWEGNTHQPIGTLKQRTRVVSMVFSPDGRTLVCGSVKGMVYLWDVGTRELIRTLQHENSSGHEDRIISVAFSPDGRTLAGGTDHGEIPLWNVETGTLKSTFVGQVGQGYVNSVVFSPDGSLLVSGGSDGTILLWGLVPE